MPASPDPPRQFRGKFISELRHNSSLRFAWDADDRLLFRYFLREQDYSSTSLSTLATLFAKNPSSVDATHADAELRHLSRSVGFDPDTSEADWYIVRDRLVRSLIYELKKWVDNGTLVYFWDEEQARRRVVWPGGDKLTWWRPALQQGLAECRREDSAEHRYQRDGFGRRQKSEDTSSRQSDAASEDTEMLDIDGSVDITRDGSVADLEAGRSHTQTRSPTPRTAEIQQQERPNPLLPPLPPPRQPREGPPLPPSTTPRRSQQPVEPLYGEHRAVRSEPRGPRSLSASAYCGADSLPLTPPPTRHRPHQEAPALSRLPYQLDQPEGRQRHASRGDRHSKHESQLSQHLGAHVPRPRPEDTPSVGTASSITESLIRSLPDLNDRLPVQRHSDTPRSDGSESDTDSDTTIRQSPLAYKHRGPLPRGQVATRARRLPPSLHLDGVSGGRTLGQEAAVHAGQARHSHSVENYGLVDTSLIGTGIEAQRPRHASTVHRQPPVAIRSRQPPLRVAIVCPGVATPEERTRSVSADLDWWEHPSQLPTREGYSTAGRGHFLPGPRVFSSDQTAQTISPGSVPSRPTGPVPSRGVQGLVSPLQLSPAFQPSPRGAVSTPTSITSTATVASAVADPRI